MYIRPAMDRRRLLYSTLVILVVLLVAWFAYEALRPRPSTVLRILPVPPIHGGNLPAGLNALKLRPNITDGKLLAYNVYVHFKELNAPLVGIADTGSFAAIFVNALPMESRQTSEIDYAGGESTFHTARLTLHLPNKRIPVEIGGGMDISHLSGGTGTQGVVGFLPASRKMNNLPSLVDQVGAQSVTMDFIVGREAVVFNAPPAYFAGLKRLYAGICETTDHLTAKVEEILFETSAGTAGRVTVSGGQATVHPAGGGSPIGPYPLGVDGAILDTGTTQPFYAFSKRTGQALRGPQEGPFLTAIAVTFRGGGVMRADVSGQDWPLPPLEQLLRLDSPVMLIGITVLRFTVISYTIEPGYDPKYPLGYHKCVSVWAGPGMLAAAPAAPPPSSPRIE